VGPRLVCVGCPLVGVHSDCGGTPYFHCINVDR